MANLGFFSNNIGALSNDFRPVFKIPADWGGITVLNAAYITETAGTSRVQIVDLGTAGTAVAAGGTIFEATAGSSVAAAGVPSQKPLPFMMCFHFCKRSPSCTLVENLTPAESAKRALSVLTGIWNGVPYDSEASKIAPMNWG